LLAANSADPDFLDLFLSGPDFPDRKALEVKAAAEAAALFILRADRRGLAAVRALRRLSGQKRATLWAYFLAINSSHARP
jgi:hypothetical protein